MFGGEPVTWCNRGVLRRILVLAVTTALTVTVLAAPSASADPRPTPAPTQAPAPTQSKDRYAIGDSVMLGARSILKRRGFTVNAAVSRQSYSAPGMVRRKGDRLPENVVVHLGTNGTFPLSTCRKLVKNAGPSRNVFLVTVSVPRSWEKSNNRTIRACADSFPAGRVTVIDWNAAARAHPQWLYSDRTHLRPAGAKGFARLIDRAVDAAGA